MMNAPIQGFFTREHKKNGNSTRITRENRFWASLLGSIQWLFLAALLFLGSLVMGYPQSNAYAAAIPGPGNACHWYTIRPGDTLSGIAARTKANVWTLARVNYIANINLIFAHQDLCIPYRVNQSCNAGCQGSYSGLQSSGVVRWYAYNALEQSTPEQVVALLRQAAAYYHLPASLLLAIAWQESGWEQHVIAHDGGIGAMQIMPYTAMSINAATGIQRDPYKLKDNIYLGANYLYFLWINFHGNQTQVISAYNEGGWAVVHRGIFNWKYVHNVSYLMGVFG
jgi:LysM repeat protein